jgi:hypothetical protein
MSREKKQRSFREFNFAQVPKCKHMKRVKLPNGVPIEICQIHKGIGRNRFVCAYTGQYPQCPHYKSKYKWGRSLWEVAGDFIGER